MIREFLRWWVRQLAALLPSRHDAGDQALVEPLSPPGSLPATVALSLRGQATAPTVLTLNEAGLGRLRAALGRRRAVRVRLPAGSLLEREVVLPIAAESAPGEVLALELDRLTPFQADATYWSFAVLRRDRVHGRLHLSLTMAPRERLQTLIESLRGAGALPTVIEAPDGRAGWRRLTLTDPAAAPRGSWRAGLALCGALAAAVVAVPFVRQARELAAIAAQREAVRPAAMEAGALRRQIATAAAGGDVLAVARQALGDPLQALAAATEALPDDTWLTDLTLRQRRMTLTGHSANAAQLIARLSAEPALRNPAFTAPVTRSDSGHGDLFAVAADLAP